MSETPTRIQRRRHKGWRTPPGAVYVGRPGRLGNPYQILPCPGGWAVLHQPTVEAAALISMHETHADAATAAVALFERHLSAEERKWIREHLPGADILLRIANAPACEEVT